MSRSSSPISTNPQRGRGVTAVLGPTNTGKTHLAIERMLAHDVGIIGLPLRLLAREVYDKIVARAGDLWISGTKTGSSLDFFNAPFEIGRASCRERV